MRSPAFGTSPRQRVVAGVAPDPIGALQALDRVVAGVAEQAVVPLPAVDLVVAAEAADDVVPRRAVDLVGELGSTQPVVPGVPVIVGRDGGRGEQQHRPQAAAIRPHDTRLKQWGMGPTS